MRLLKLNLLLVGCSIAISYANADCTFEFINSTDHPVTLQGFYLDNGDDVDSKNWITLAPKTTATQVRSGTVACNANYRHSGQLVTKVTLKNSSGYWTGNKGFLFSSDRSYANIGTDMALADDESQITLSTGIPITKEKFKVEICDGSVNSDECN